MDGGTCIITMTTGFILLTAMFLGYKAKWDKGKASLEKEDREHQKRHHHNEERIKELEKKNGHEQRQIDSLKEELKQERTDKGELKNLVIKLQDRIINCEKKETKTKH